MNTSRFKSNISSLPNYLDGQAKVFVIEPSDDDYSIDFLVDIGRFIYFEELSISDSLRYEFEQRDSKLTIKLRTNQTKEITSKNVLKIGNEFHKVYNAYHFTNKDGFKQSDLTLEEYFNPKFEEVKKDDD